jgi:hypothetical protein
MELQVIQSKIHEIRGLRVMLDFDLAVLYGVTTGNLNKAVKRNIERFPERFMFQLTKEEILLFQNGISSWGGSRTLPYAFTEQGVAMLSAILRSPVAIQVSISIMDAFVALREMVMSSAVVTAELAEIRAKLALLEHNDEETLEALNDLSEDMRHELADIYTAIGELSIKPVAPRAPIGYKRG